MLPWPPQFGPRKPPLILSQTHVWYQPPTTLGVFVWSKSCPWWTQGQILQRGRQVWPAAVRGLLISKHRWEWGGQRLEQCQHTGSIWGLFVTLLLLLLLLWLSFGPFEYQAVCKNFCRLVACERWDCVIGASVNREELRCSPKHPFSPWWSAGVVPNGSLPVAKSFIPKPLLFHRDHLVLAQHIPILLGAAFYSAF